MKTLLTIAGYDPSSGAGITADMAVFAAHGYFGTSAITALTVQSTLGVRHVEPVSAELLHHTLRVLHEDLRPSGVKVGMLATHALVEAVADFANTLDCPVVLDPVIRSSSGKPLLDEMGVAALKAGMLRWVDWITPNIDELHVLTGMPASTQEEIPAAALALHRETLAGVIVTGGHLDPPNDYVFPHENQQGSWLPGKRAESNSTHGTGCAFSSAFLCGLVDGLAPEEAAQRAKDFVFQSILHAPGLGHGKGPMDLLWPLRHGC